MKLYRKKSIMIENQFTLKEDSYPITDILTMPFATYALLIAIIEFDLFNKLHDNPSTIAEVCNITGIKQRPARALLQAFVGLNLLKKIENRYYLSSLSEAFLVKGKPFHMDGSISILKKYYASYDQFKNAILTDEPQMYGTNDVWEVHKKDDEKVSLFTRAMHDGSKIRGASIAENFDFSGYKKILDIGGGSGGVPIMIALNNPHMEATIFDLPSVCREAEKIIGEYNLSDRINTISGDMFNDIFPEGRDVVIFSRILHDWNPDKCKLLLEKTYAALPSRGVVIVNELLIDDDRPEERLPFLDNLVMLVWTEGQQYTKGEMIGLMEGAGFINVSVKPIAGQSKIITAYKP